MITYDEHLEQELLAALSALYDPDYAPSERLCTLLGCESGEAITVQSALMRAIEAVKPSPDVPSTARMGRIYRLLHSRFVLKLTQEETANRLHMSISNAWRVQREAVHTLARVIWERYQRSTGPDESHKGAGEGEAANDFQASDWRSQAERELSSLHASAPNAVADVRETIDALLELQEARASAHGTRIHVEFVQPSLVAQVHPSVLLQTLVAAVERLADAGLVGPLTIFAGLEEGDVKIDLTAALSGENGPIDGDLVNDIWTPEGVSIDAHTDDVHLFLSIKLPSAGRVTVLVVDDNEDMIRFYRRSTDGTKYHLVHTREGRDVFERVEAVAPRIIVLDVMLPDIDGWRLLMHLRQNPLTRSTPIVICSVVQERELALSLGATCYLSKPVRPREFIQVLDRMLIPAPGGASTPPATSVAGG